MGALLRSGGVPGAFGSRDSAAIPVAAGLALWMVGQSRHLSACGDAVTVAAAELLLAAFLALPVGAAASSRRRSR